MANSAATYGAQRSRDCHAEVVDRVPTFRTFDAVMSDYCTVGADFVTIVTLESEANYRYPSSSISVTSAAMGERSDRVRVTCAKSG